MSNTTRYDSLLIRETARELSAGLRGRRVREVAFERALDAVRIRFDDRWLEWSLADGGGPRFLPPNPAESRPLPVLRKATLAAIEAPADERILQIRLAGGARLNAVATVVIELIGTNWNALALDHDQRILKKLRVEPETEERRRGARYSPPAARPREGATEPVSLSAWLAILEPVPAAERVGVALDRIAWLSALNVNAVLGLPPRAANLDAPSEAANPSALTASHARYRSLIDGAPSPCVLSMPGPQPYCSTLWRSDASLQPALLAAFDAARESAGSNAALQLHRLLERARKKRSRLAEEADQGATEAAQLRAAGDLLLSSIAQVPRGAKEVTLTDFAGGEVRLELDPSVNAAANAKRYYDHAKKRQRAAERLPEMIRDTDAQIARLEHLRERAEAGEQIKLDAAPARGSVRMPTGRARPYRRYRTSGGLEVRVGRNSRSNDELTFHHARPDDVWLHAREVGGAHVVLRWDSLDNPPKQDLHEAGVLAALHSKARTSGMVAIDWTRRKYVRKPRRSAPGSVLVERAATLFVEPDAKVEQKLRWAEEEV